MEIEVKTHALGKYMELIVKSDNTTVTTDWLSPQEVLDIVEPLVSDVLLHNIYRADVIDKLIDLGILEEDMICQWYDETYCEQ